MEADFLIKHIAPKDRGQWLHDRLSRHPHVIEIDFDRYDSTQHAEIKKLEAYLIQWLLGSEFGRIWRNVVAGENAGHFDDSFKYWVEATMMSGEQTTALFNALLNHWIFLFSKQELQFDGIDSVEGDDGAFATSVRVAQELVRLYSELGFSIKIKETTIEDVGFISSNLMFDGKSYQLVRRIDTAIIKQAWSTKYRGKAHSRAAMKF